MTPKLKYRDKRALIIALAAIGLFVIIQFVFSPLMERRNVLKRQISIAENQLGEMHLLQQQFSLAKAAKSLPDNRVLQKKDFNLFSVLEQHAGESGLKGHIAYMKPSTREQKGSTLKLSMVEMKLETLTIVQLLQLLYRVETFESRVNINRLSINKTSKPEGFIDVVIQAETLVEQ
jgi:hypothetical protein